MEFKHIPVMLDECIDGLKIKSDGIYFDGTLGGAGHSSVILSQLKTGRLIATDKDDDALSVATERLGKISKNFVTIKSDFKNFSNILDELKIDKIDGVLLDLGVSSYQIDNAERGFSYNTDAPLDMRMDRSSLLTAEMVVNEYEPEKLTKIFYEYGEEQDFAEAMRWYQKSGDIADVAKLRLQGKMYYLGQGTARNYSKAFGLFQKASSGSDASGDAMHYLSHCYRFGHGTAQDLRQADYWEKKAQETGSDEAVQYLEEFKRSGKIR